MMRIVTPAVPWVHAAHPARFASANNQMCRSRIIGDRFDLVAVDDLFANPSLDITASDAPIEISLDRDNFTMNSKVHVSIIVVGKGNKFMSPMIQIDGLDPAERAKQTVLTWFSDDGRLCVAFHAAHDNWLREQAVSYYRRYADKWR